MRFIVSLFASILTCRPVVYSRGAPGSVQEGMERAVDIQREGLERLRSFLGPFPPPTDEFAKRQPATISFSNPESDKFLVDGANLPLVPFDAGPSWAGLLPISGAKNETRKLFFWYVDFLLILAYLVYLLNAAIECGQVLADKQCI